MKVKLAMMTYDTRFRFLTLEDPAIVPGSEPHLVNILINGKSTEFIIADEVALHFFNCCNNIRSQGLDMTIMIIAEEIVGMVEGIEKDSELIHKLYIINSEKDIHTIQRQCLFKFRKNNKDDIEYFIPSIYIEDNKKSYYWNNVPKTKHVKVLLGHKQDVNW